MQHPNTMLRGNAPASRRVLALASGIALAAVCLVGLSTLGASAAPDRPAAITATTCDQAYGCNTTSTVPPPSPACGLSATSVNAGDSITATVTNVAVGDRIDITFDGQVIASATSTADGQGQAAAGMVIAPAGHLAAVDVTFGGAVITFRIPSATATGTYEVRAIGPGFNADCAEGSNGVSVLGAAISTGPGGFANTGIEVGVYVAVALVLIVAGAQLVRFARRRRRRTARRKRSSATHAVR